MPVDTRERPEYESITAFLRGGHLPLARIPSVLHRLCVAHRAFLSIRPVSLSRSSRTSQTLFMMFRKSATSINSRSMAYIVRMMVSISLRYCVSVFIDYPEHSGQRFAL